MPPHLVASTIEVLSLVARAPIVTVPTARRVLAIAPHPDDETIGCGATLARLARDGARVEVVVCTDGEATIGSPHDVRTTARLRRAEAVAACTHLGVPPPVAFGLPDGGLAAHLDVLSGLLADHLGDWSPDLVLVPWALERHPDHRAVLTALARLAPHPAEVWCYEVHTPLHPTHVVPCATPDLERKRAALAAHRTAERAFRLDATLGLARWRSLAASAGEGHAEAFHVVEWGELATLAQLGARAWDRRPPSSRSSAQAR